VKPSFTYRIVIPLLTACKVQTLTDNHCTDIDTLLAAKVKELLG
jgi:ribosome recycling factor